MAHSTSGEGSSLEGGEAKKLFKCPLCHLSFKSMNAVGGHQNAHRRQRNRMKRFIISKKKKKMYYEFLPLKQGNAGIYGYGRAFQNPLHRLFMMPTSFAAHWVPSHASIPNTCEVDLSLKL